MSTTEQSVYNRYAAAAEQVEKALCCPVDYNQKYLEIIPDEILEKDYGCGDPSPYVRPGDTVLDLGSGGGKLCYIAAQVVGPSGKVIGVDCNQSMLALANKYQPHIAEKLSYDNVDFRYGLIQDLQLDLNLLDQELGKSSIDSAEEYLALRNIESRIRNESPLIASDSIDCVVSNCVLNLVQNSDRKQLFAELHRVLKVGGRVAISDIVSDETIPAHMQKDGRLWSGCLSGAFREDEFLDAFREAGFYGIEISKRQSEPWQTIEGIEFRSMTVVAHKGVDEVCLDRNQAVVYKGPFEFVKDDHDHTFPRGQRIAVCDSLFRRLRAAPYRDMFEFIEPRIPVSLDEAKEFDCSAPQIKPASVTKGASYNLTVLGQDCCGPESDECCS